MSGNLTSALLLIAAGGGAFLFADKYHLSEAWVFGAWAAMFFFCIRGLGYRRKFRDPAFVSFFLAWTLLQASGLCAARAQWQTAPASTLRVSWSEYQPLTPPEGINR